MKKNEFKIHDNEPIMPTGVVCRLLDIPIWVLKQLDREKIISPPRKKGKSRLYSQSEVLKLRHIWFLMKTKKVKVDGVKVILEMEAKFYKVKCLVFYIVSIYSLQFLQDLQTLIS